MPSQALVPPPDAATVIGPDNATYWLVLLVRTEAITTHRPMYCIAVAAEVVALAAGFTLHLRGFVLTWRLRAIHINFLLLAAAMYAVMIAGSIARLITIPFEMRLIHFIGLYEAPIPFLAIVRQTAYTQIFYIMCAYTIERTFATIYVVDYEQRKRVHISMVLNVAITVACSAGSYAVVTGILNPYVVASVGLLANVCCAMWFRWLLRHNERRLARLTDHIRRHHDEYSLSLRVQLRENVWSMKKIQLGMALLLTGIIANATLVFVPLLLLTALDQSETLQWLTCAGNLSYALSVLVTSPWLEVAMAIHTGRPPSILRALLGSEFFPKQRDAPLSETDSHFRQLDTQWSYGLNERRKSFLLGK